MVISSIFIAECAIKVIALGFYYDNNSYLSDPWSRLDFVIVMFGILDFNII